METNPVLYQLMGLVEKVVKSPATFNRHKDEFQWCVDELHNELGTIQDVCQYQNEIAKLKTTISILKTENSKLASENTQLRTDRFKRFNDEECWIYQGDESDHLESLVCPVVIHPYTLIGLLEKSSDAQPDTISVYDRSDIIHILRGLGVDVTVHDDWIKVQANLMDGVLGDFLKLVKKSKELGENPG